MEHQWGKSIARSQKRRKLDEGKCFQQRSVYWGCKRKCKESLPQNVRWGVTAGDFSGSFLHGKRCHYWWLACHTESVWQTGSQDGLLHVHGVFNGSCAWQQHDQFKNVQRGQRGTWGDRSELRWDRGSGAGSGTWKWRTRTSCSLLYGVTGNTWIRSLRLWNPLPLRYVQTEDQRWLSGRSAG